MKVYFDNKDLELYATEERATLKALGKLRANLYRRRIRAMMLVPNFEMLRLVAGNFHELVGNRKGQWACNLDQPYRLISKGAEPNENVVWANVSEAKVLEIVDYHR